MLSYISIALIVFVIIYRLVFITKYRFFYMATSFITLRIWITVLAAMIYASGHIFMYELDCYSKYTWKIILLLSGFSLLILWCESKFSKRLSEKIIICKKNIKKIKYSSLLVKYDAVIALVFTLSSLFLFLEAYNVGGIGSIVGMSKFNFFSYVAHPTLFKILYGINPLIVLAIAYGLSVRNASDVEHRNYAIKLMLYFLLFIGFMSHSFVYGLIQAKSHFILTYLMFFIVPITFFNKVHGVVFFRSFTKLFAFTSILLFFLVSVFYMHYGDLFFELLFKRLLLEGQFLFATLNDFYHDKNNIKFIAHLPKAGEDSAVVQLMDRYLASSMFNLYDDTGWTMSGAMPGYNFIFEDFWLGLFYWFLNIYFMYFIFLESLKYFVFGNIITSFLCIKLYWYIVGYIALGENYLYKPLFWFLVLSLLGCHIFRLANKVFSSVKHNENHLLVNSQKVTLVSDSACVKCI